MSRVQAELEYLFKERTDTWIARETGIPRSTIGFVRRGERDLPKEYLSDLRNAYQREAYARLRSEGMSSIQADRFKWYAPEHVAKNEAEMHGLVDKFTTGAVTAKIRQLRREGVSFDEEQLWIDIREQIVESLQRSKAPVEDIAEGIT